MMAGLLEGKVVVVTGASRGIGEAIAIRYAMEGASVVVSARTLNDGDHPLSGGINTVVERIKKGGGKAAAVRCDLVIENHRTHLISETEKLFGPVDILVNNAAITYFMTVDKFKLNRFDLMFEVQVKAPFHLSQLILPSMQARKSGRILNISSHAALHPAKDAPSRGSAVYGMCKAALERFTTGLAAEVYAQHIGVNVISPGLVATPGVVHHKLITQDTPDDAVTPVEDMAEACLRLVHGSAQDFTGLITYADEMISNYKLSPKNLAY
jgi:citronellol/citronellal dehydrogenase